MTHYICKGENCKTVSDRPSVCLSTSCVNRYKLLEECNCPHKESHFSDDYDVEKYKYKYASKINVINFGWAFGIVTGVYFFTIGLIAHFTGLGKDMVVEMSSLYIGYNYTLIGSIAGGLWGLIDGFIAGVIIAYLYNLISKTKK